ncbi:hypothetical protein FACS189490_12200 [Clostridia bacterium]|nr:hypothetical protein FACS189490_12200 [Clostridia bacterium]
MDEKDSLAMKIIVDTTDIDLLIAKLKEISVLVSELSKNNFAIL